LVLIHLNFVRLSVKLQFLLLALVNTVISLLVETV